MAARDSITKVVPFVIAKVAAAAGADARTILDGTGISPDVVPSADDHIAIDGYLGVWRRAMAQLSDPAFPTRVASTFQLEDSEVFGFLAMACATIRQAIERTVSYSALYCSGATWEIWENADEARIVWLPWPGDPHDLGYRAAMDYTLADMANGIRRLGRGSPSPSAVRVVHRAPAMTSGFIEYYGVEPTYGGTTYEVVYPPGTPDLPLITFNSKLRDYFDEECRRLVSQMEGDPSVVVKVRKQLIGAMDGGNSSVDEVARRLGMSPRSLQRRLAEEGTRYNDLLAGVRAEFAKRYLARGSISASEVAYLIGFTEPPAFFKAFKRWTGMTPKEFQEGAPGG